MDNLDRLADAVSDRHRWNQFNIVEKWFRVWQYGLGLAAIVTGRSTFKCAGRAVSFQQTVAYCALVRKVISAAKFGRDLAWMYRKDYYGHRGIYLKSTLGDPKTGEYKTHYHFGSFGKQVALVPNHFVSLVVLGQMAGLYSLPCKPLLSTISQYGWFIAMTCDASAQWSRQIDTNLWENGRDYPTVTKLPVDWTVAEPPYGLVGTNSEFALALFEVALAKHVPRWTIEVLGVWTGVYWLSIAVPETLKKTRAP